MLCVKPLHEVIRNEQSILEKIHLVRDIGIDRGIDYKAEIQSLVTSQAIITTYNKRVYRVDGVSWDKTPESTFCIVKDGEEFHLSFFDYFKLRHKIELTDLSQPMLVHYDARRDQMVYLAPELCRFVGVSEQMIEQRKPFTEVKIARRTDAPIKIKQATKLINHLMENQECQNKMEQWRFYFEQQVLPVQGLKYNAGNILMGV